MDRVLYVAAAIVALGAAAEVLRRAVAWMIRTVRKLARLADDLLGEPPSLHHPEGRPGLMVRVAGIEATQADMLGRLAGLEELRPNGGGSIKDQVTRIAQATGANQT